MKPGTFMEATDDRGQPLLVRCDEVAVVRACDPAAFQNSVIVLRSGEVIALMTEFKTVVDRLSTD